MWKSHQAVIRFVGDISGRRHEGHWVGIELSTKNGDNAGAIDGRWYFSCPPETGVFCRMWDLTDGKVPTKEDLEVDVTGPHSTLQTSAPPATVSQLRDVHKLQSTKNIDKQVTFR